MVRVETMLPACETVVAENAQAAPVGSPEQANVIGDVEGNPFSGVSVMISVPLAPAVTVSDGVETPTVKVGPEPDPDANVAALAWLEAADIPYASTASTT